MSEGVGVILQARMGSTRLPGKVLKLLGGMTLLEYILHRLESRRRSDPIVVATTTDTRNDAVADLCRRAATACFRGSEDDVLDRYYHAAVQYAADVVVRITADCPFIDPAVTDMTVNAYLHRTAPCDGATNTVRRTYPRGLDTEAFPIAVIRKVWEEAREPSAREHVTPYIYMHPERFTVTDVTQNEDLSHLRWTVDEEADLAFAREVYRRLYRPGAVFLMNDIVAVLTKNPALIAINAAVRQKTVS